MVASIVNRGLINDELFFESNGEIWVVWDRMRGIVPVWRAAFKNPKMFANIEETYHSLLKLGGKACAGVKLSHAQYDVASALKTEDGLKSRSAVEITS